MVKNTYGTGSFVLMNTGARIAGSQHRLLSSAAWTSVTVPEYVLEGSIFVTGGAIQWLRDGLGICGRLQRPSHWRDQCPTQGERTSCPLSPGSVPRTGDPYARGAFLGITGGTSKGHLALGCGRGDGLSDP